MKNPRHCCSLAYFATVFLFAVCACDDSTSFSRVSVTGVPECPGSWLERPLMVELTSGEAVARELLTGHSSDLARPPAIDLPEGRHEWEVRFGVCRTTMSGESGTYNCGEVDWYGSETVEIDTATGSIAVPDPPMSACLPPQAE